MCFYHVLRNYCSVVLVGSGNPLSYSRNEHTAPHILRIRIEIFCMLDCYHFSTFNTNSKPVFRANQMILVCANFRWDVRGLGRSKKKTTHTHAQWMTFYFLILLKLNLQQQNFATNPTDRHINHHKYFGSSNSCLTNFYHFFSVKKAHWKCDPFLPYGHFIKWLLLSASTRSVGKTVAQRPMFDHQ